MYLVLLSASACYVHLNNCFGVRVAVSAWSAGVGQHLNGLQMEKTPRRQNAYNVNRMKMARGTKEYITWTYFAGGGIISDSQKPHLPLQSAQV